MFSLPTCSPHFCSYMLLLFILCLNVPLCGIAVYHYTAFKFYLAGGFVSVVDEDIPVN